MGAAWTAFHLGSIELDRGRLDAAAAAFASVEPRDAALGRIFVARLDLRAGIALARGDVRATKQLLDEELRGLEHAVGQQEATAHASYWLGAAALAAGDLDEARDRLEESARLMRELQWRERLAYCESLLAEIDVEAGAIASARARLMNALAIWRERQAWVEEMRVRVAVARLDLRAGKPVAAEAVARLATTAFAASSLGDDRVLALALLPARCARRADT